MRIKCPHCQSKAVIYGNNAQSDAVTDVYCRCTNTECQGSFVMTVSHSHDIQPPVTSAHRSLHQALFQVFANLPEDQALKILADLTHRHKTA